MFRKWVCATDISNSQIIFGKSEHLSSTSGPSYINVTGSLGSGHMNSGDRPRLEHMGTNNSSKSGHVSTSFPRCTNESRLLSSNVPRQMSTRTLLLQREIEGVGSQLSPETMIKSNTIKLDK